MAQRLFFRNKALLVNALKEYFPTLDVEKSKSRIRSRFSLVFGEEVIYSGTVSEMVSNLNKVAGKDIFVKRAYLKGKSGYVIFLNEDPKELVVEDAVQEQEEKSEVEKTEIDKEVVAPDAVDWEWVEGLGNTKEDKLALDQYAEKFDVKLSRTMKIENMVAKFKEALEAK
ncbi:hypothetical protein [Vibrio phage RYC]|nr:hypothetical protein [Vibrio phage RYC]